MSAAKPPKPPSEPTAPELTPAEPEANRQAAIEELKAGRLPDFALAKFTEFSPELLIVSGSDSQELRNLKRLTLTLALVFNDLKDLGWALTLHSYGNPGNLPLPNAYQGQWTAMGEYFARLATAHCHELQNVLEANLGTIDSASFQEGLSSVSNAQAREDWERLVSSARASKGAGGGRGLAALLPVFDRHRKVTSTRWTATFVSPGTERHSTTGTAIGSGTCPQRLRSGRRKQG
ncbi:MAG: hypothetical protein ACLPJH_00170 [Myxococcaceae bacterium]